jgi:hypothetical protein
MSDAGHPPHLVEGYVSTYFDGMQKTGTFEYFDFLFSLDDETAEYECIDRATKIAEELHE